MDALKIAFVDDDQGCLDTMADLVQDFTRSRQSRIETASFLETDSFLHSFRSSEYAAVFMDIYFRNGQDGMTAARELRCIDSGLLLIFLTSSPDFMPGAFSCHAFDYVVKPVTRKRIFTVLADMMEVIQPERPYVELRTGRQSVRVFHDEIVSASSEGHYMNIRLGDGRILRTRMTAREFAALVDGDPRFLLINKGIIVNADTIADFEGNTCLLGNGERLPVRVRDRLRIEQAARDYNFERIRSRQHRRRT